MFHRALSGDFFFVVSRRRSGSSDIRVASVALVTSQTTQHCVTPRGPRRQAHLKPKTKQTIGKVVCRPAPARITSSISTVIRSASRVHSRTASSSCYPARVTQGIFPANVLVRSMALAHCHLPSIMFSRRGRPWNTACRDLLLPRYPVSTWSYTARQTSEDGWHVASEAFLHPRGPCHMTSTDCFSSQTTLSFAFGVFRTWLCLLACRHRFSKYSRARSLDWWSDCDHFLLRLPLPFLSQPAPARDRRSWSGTAPKKRQGSLATDAERACRRSPRRYIPRCAPWTRRCVVALALVDHFDGHQDALQGQDEFLDPLQDLAHRTFLDDLLFPDLRLSRFHRWLFSWPRHHLFRQVSTVAATASKVGTASSALSLSFPFSSPLTVLLDTVYPKFQVPSISSFQFQIRKI